MMQGDENRIGLIINTTGWKWHYHEHMHRNEEVLAAWYYNESSHNLSGKSAQLGTYLKWLHANAYSMRNKPKN